MASHILYRRQEGCLLLFFFFHLFSFLAEETVLPFTYIRASTWETRSSGLQDNLAPRMRLPRFLSLHSTRRKHRRSERKEGRRKGRTLACYTRDPGHLLSRLFTTPDDSDTLDVALEKFNQLFACGLNFK